LRSTVLTITLINLAFFIFHEIEAIYRNEWKMLTILKNVSDPIKKRIYLYLHLPLPSILVGYVYSVFILCFYEFFILFNLFAVIHLFLHIYFLKKSVNVFSLKFSFIIMIGFALTGIVNLILISHIIC